MKWYSCKCVAAGEANTLLGGKDKFAEVLSSINEPGAVLSCARSGLARITLDL